MNVKISDLTLEEKMHLLIGSGRWDIYDANGKIPNVSMNDGPHGLRKLQGNDTSTTIPCHAYPSLSLLASSWDANLVSNVSSAIADECIQHGTDILLAPGINIKRMPLCGRNFEYFSEDPLLAGVLGRSYIEGVQKRNVLATVKHFCANNQETYRSQASSEVDERTLNEIYLRPFELALEAKPACVMCAYNAINGIFVSENQFILKEILREKFGFDGMLMSDWFAVTERARALKATLDLQMPEDEYGFNELKEAYEAGFITEEEIDASVERILKLIETCVENRKSAKRELSEDERSQIAIDAVANSVVLLKNEGNVLPLKKGSSALVAGCCMDYTPALGGAGSSLVVPIKRPLPLSREMRESGYFSTVLENRPTVNIYTPVDVGIVTVGSRSEEEREAWDRTGLRLRNTEEQMI
ncbi:MAG: glycoside hydrolase family 3 C-terminal domain-containing protein, partial [Oscillospiraceae bacterium]|nr:glycoside hydrolase family 3 C-terminal domain-containing protein [Oscillospiraceae bacterium]